MNNGLSPSSENASPSQELFELRELDRVLGVLLFAAVCRGHQGAGAAHIDVLVAKVRPSPRTNVFKFKAITS